MFRVRGFEDYKTDERGLFEEGVKACFCVFCTLYVSLRSLEFVVVLFALPVLFVLGISVILSLLVVLIVSANSFP